MQDANSSYTGNGFDDRERAWELLVRHHETFVRRCVVHQMAANGWRPRNDEIEDLTQEVFVRLFERAARGRPMPERSLRGYLGRMARSAVVDRIRHRTAAKRGDGVRVALEELETSPRAVDPRQTPEEELLGREARRRLRARIAALLPPRGRERCLQILELSVWEGWTYAEIAERLGDLKPASVATVMLRLRRRLSGIGLGDILA